MSKDKDISPPPLKRRRLQTSADKREPDDCTLTVYSWNVNGITPFVQQTITSFFGSENTQSQSKAVKRDGRGNSEGAEQESYAPSLRAFLRRHDWPTVLCLQEVKINPDDKATQLAVEKAVQPRRDEAETAPSYTAHFCLPTDKYNAGGFGRKVYGVCTIIRADFYARCVTAVRPVSWDQEGRFLVMETEATDAVPKIALVNVYAVNGTENPYRDPQTGQVSGTRHDRKLKVHSLLQAECQRLEAEGLRCIVAGDLNIARAPLDGHPNLRTFPVQHCINRADFEEKFFAHSNAEDCASDEGQAAPSRLEMIDTFRHLYPDKRGYTYYPRTKKFGESCDRVDMILIGKELKTFLKVAGMYETSADRGPSDHIPLYAQLEFGQAGEAVV